MKICYDLSLYVIISGVLRGGFMQGYLTIILGEDENRIELSPHVRNDEYCVAVFVKDITSFEEIKDNEELLNDMSKVYEYMFGKNDRYNILTRYLEEHFDDIKKFICTCSEVSISGEPQQIKQYIKENGFEKKIVLYNDVLPLKREILDEMTEYFGDMPCVKFFIEGNDAPVTLEEYTKTVAKIEEIALSVRKLGLSPIEEIMYVYDLVRDRKYIEEEDTEEYTVSRDLTSVLFGDKIVCVGFSILFNSILNCLGYDTMKFVLSPLNGKDSHMRSLVYVKDEKYNIDGMYFFDPTYDCKKDNSDSFLERYLCFAKTYRQIIKLDSENFDSPFYRYMDDEAIDEIESLFSEDEISVLDLYRKLNFSYLNKILRFAKVDEVTIAKPYINKESLIDRICEVSFLANQDITYDKFLDILYNVRRQQYYINPEKYAFDINAITDILVKSRISRKSENNKENLLVALLGIDSVVGAHEAPVKVREHFDKNDLEKDMLRVKLARLLKTELEKKEMEEKKLSFKN